VTINRAKNDDFAWLGVSNLFFHFTPLHFLSDGAHTFSFLAKGRRYINGCLLARVTNNKQGNSQTYNFEQKF